MSLSFVISCLKLTQGLEFWLTSVDSRGGDIFTCIDSKTHEQYDALFQVKS